MLNPKPIVQRLQLLHGDIVKMNLTVNPQIPDPARQHGVFRTSQIQNDNHVLFHFPPFSANQRFVRPPVRRHFIIKEWRQPFFGTNPGSYRPPFRIRTGVLFPDFLARQMAVHALKD